MIIIHVMGGLGNQLYQYALSEKLKTLGREVKLDFYAYRSDTPDEDQEWRRLELPRFPHIEYEACTPEERTRFLDNSRRLTDRVRRKLVGRHNKTVSESADYMPQIYDMEDAYLYGYWGCERYYEDILPLLRKRLAFPASSDARNAQCMERMAHENAVSVHIRRQDYLTVADGARYMGICTEAYYRGAFDYIEARVAEPVYYIFSDDIDYAREHFQGKNIRIVDWNGADGAVYDMALMSHCRHHICANSTFSMWGARLSPYEDKLMLRPMRHDNYERINAQELCTNWKEWIILDERGQNIRDCSCL